MKNLTNETLKAGAVVISTIFPQFGKYKISNVSEKWISYRHFVPFVSTSSTGHQTSHCRLSVKKFLEEFELAD